MLWPAPVPLEGVKSRKRTVLAIPSITVGQVPCTEHGKDLELTLSSRVAISGTAGKLAKSFLLAEAEEHKTMTTRHPGLIVLHLHPSQLHADHLSAANCKDAIIRALIQHRPHIVLLDQARDVADSGWLEAFDDVVASNELHVFRGGVVICSDTESRSVAKVCSEQWVIDKNRLQAARCLEIIEDALGDDTEVDTYLREALEIDYCNLRYWLDKARKNSWDVTVCVGGTAPSRSLHGLIFHHLKAEEAELHIDFIFVPKHLRSHGLGGRLLRWAIGKAEQMQQTDCRWISLFAADDTLVSWYENVGFTAMPYGHVEVEDDDDMTWMLLKITSRVSEGE